MSPRNKKVRKDTGIIKDAILQGHFDNITELTPNVKMDGVYNYIDIVLDSSPNKWKSLNYIQYPIPKSHKPDEFYNSLVHSRLPVNYSILKGYNKLKAVFSIDWIVLVRVVPHYHRAINDVKRALLELSIRPIHKPKAKVTQYFVELQPGKITKIEVLHNRTIDNKSKHNRSSKTTKHKRPNKNKDVMYVPLTVKVHKPSREDILPLLRIIGTSFKPSAVEFTVDLHGKNAKMLYAYFKEQLVFSYVRKELYLGHDTTSYQGNPRKGPVAGRIYIKDYEPEEGKLYTHSSKRRKFLRLEVNVQKRFLNSIGCTELFDIFDVKPSQVFKRWKLKVLNYPLIYKRCRQLNPLFPRLAFIPVSMAIIAAKKYDLKAADKYLKRYFKYTALKDHPQQGLFNPDPA